MPCMNRDMKMRNLVTIISLLIISCTRPIPDKIATERDFDLVVSKYDQMSDDVRIKAVNEVINYYQFSDSDKALNFLRIKYQTGDKVVIDAVMLATKVGIEIPLDQQHDRAKDTRSEE